MTWIAISQCPNKYSIHLTIRARRPAIFAMCVSGGCAYRRSPATRGISRVYIYYLLLIYLLPSGAARRHLYCLSLRTGRLFDRQCLAAACLGFWLRIPAVASPSSRTSGSVEFDRQLFLIQIDHSSCSLDSRTRDVTGPALRFQIGISCPLMGAASKCKHFSVQAGSRTRTLCSCTLLVRMVGSTRYELAARTS